jgi:DnaK suppressor protein
MVTDSELTEDELTELAELLRARRSDDIAEAQRLAESLGEVLASRADGTADDEHDPEGPTMSFEWTRLQTLRGDTAQDIRAVDAAIARVDDGTFGVCTRCGRPIGAERLRARPTAELCIACALTVDG